MTFAFGTGVMVATWAEESSMSEDQTRTLQHQRSEHALVLGSVIVTCFDAWPTLGPTK